jgi:hypothetical protein
MRTTPAVAAAIAGLSLFAAAGAAHAQGAVSPACSALETAAETALGAAATAAPASVGYVGLADAPGCLISFSGTGETFGTSFQAVATKLDTLLTGEGWTRDPGADADGTTGTAGGYKKGGELLAVSVGYETPKGVCREDEPTASCKPTAAQMNYTITLGLRPAS